jgi:hypothetical protein
MAATVTLERQNRLRGGSRSCKKGGERSPRLESQIRSDVEVEVKLVRVRPQAHGVVFALLQLDKIVDEVL